MPIPVCFIKGSGSVSRTFHPSVHTRSEEANNQRITRNTPRGSNLTSGIKVINFCFRWTLLRIKRHGVPQPALPWWHLHSKLHLPPQFKPPKTRTTMSSRLLFRLRLDRRGPAAGAPLEMTKTMTGAATARADTKGMLVGFVRATEQGE